MLPMLNPDTLTLEDVSNPETYDRLILIDNPVQRETIKARLDEIARSNKVGGSPVKTGLRLAKLRLDQAIRASGSKMTLFKDSPFPALFCGQWICDDHGVRREDSDALGNRQLIWACPHPIAPTERLLNVDTGLERLRLSYYKDGRWRELIANRSDLAESRQIVKRVADMGVEVSSETARSLVKYIADVVAANPDPAYLPAHKAISRLGWLDGQKSFVPYCDGISYDGDDSFSAIFGAVRQSGHYEAWLAEMRYLRRDNILFRLVLATSFASPLLEPLHALPFVLHLWGGTGSGKTVAGMCAMSVWGDPQKGRLTWTLNSTQTFLYKAASFLRNVPLFGDELQAVDTRSVSLDRLIMRLCEGIDRGRGTANGGVQQTAQWDCAFIFTGEQSISSAASGGGVKNRLIEVQLRDGQVLVPNGNHVVSIVTNHYGHAGRKYVEYLMQQDWDAIIDRYAELQREIMAAKDTSDKQAYSMAAILLASELACKAIFGGDEPLKVQDVLPYLIDRKEIDVAARAYDWVLSWINTNPVRWLSQPDNNGERWGKIDGEVATIDRYVLEEHLDAAGYPYSACISAWAARGLIIKSTSGRNMHAASVSGHKGYYIKLVLPKDEEKSTDMPF